MLTGINFGEDRLEQAANEFVEGMRVDAPPERMSELVGTFLPEPKVRPLFLVHAFAHAEKVMDSAQGVIDYDMELLNEVPEMDDTTPEGYVDGVRAVARDAAIRGFKGRLIAGAPGSNAGTAIKWYSRIIDGQRLADALPVSVALAFHWYPRGTQDSRTRPWPPSKSIRESLATLKNLAGPRDLICTEWGYHTIRETKWGFWSTQLTDEQVYEYLMADLRLFDSYGVAGAYAYQWRDGPGGQDVTEFGLHEADGATAKRQMAALKDWRTA